MKRADAVLLGAAAALALGFKYGAGRANADELAFLLEPTAWLVERATGHDFVRERGSGPFSRELALVIAPSCAGTNYAVVAFSTLVFGFVPRLDGIGKKLAFALAATALAYGATLLVNATRITLSIHAGTTGDALHRAEGVVVYLGSLLALWLGVEAGLFGRVRREARGFLAFPLGVYLAVTLVVPALNGAATRPAFFGHAASVLGVGVGLWLVVRSLLRRFSPDKLAIRP